MLALDIHRKPVPYARTDTRYSVVEYLVHAAKFYVCVVVVYHITIVAIG